MSWQIIDCPDCQGEGRDIRYGLMYEAGCNHPHMGEVDHGLCQTCNGACVIEVDAPPRTLADMDEEDFEMLQAQLDRCR